MEKVKYWLDLYEKFNGCNCYEIYFILKHNLYKIELKTLEEKIIKIGRESSSKGRIRKIKICYNKSTKRKLANEWKS